MNDWPGRLTRLQAIELIDRATDNDDPYWDCVVEDFYDEESDTWPSIYEVFAALGITESEYREATNSQEANINWPSYDTPPKEIDQ